MTFSQDLIHGLYGLGADVQSASNRFNLLADSHKEIFGKCPDFLCSASGRTELGGNHTDHNLGKVVAGSISFDTIAAVRKTQTDVVNFMSDGYKSVSVNLSNLSPIKTEENKTDALVRGIAASFAKRGVAIGGFDANVSSLVLQGSGLSSSASVEILIGTIFNSLYNNGKFSNKELAIIGREAENDYFGKPCGLMDQIACANGGVVGIDFKDMNNPIITPVVTDFESWGYALVITNVRENHANLTPDYAAIPSEMRSVAAYFGKSNLGEVESSLFFSEIADVRKAVKNDRAVLRACHFFAETERASDMICALQNNDVQRYLELVRESGRSSYMFLQNIYSQSNIACQAIALAIANSERILGKNCVCRVHGGGFAGTVQSYVPLDFVKKYSEEMEKLFGEGCSVALAIRSLPATFINL